MGSWDYDGNTESEDSNHDEKLLNEVKQACPEGVELARFLGIMVRLGYLATKDYGKRHHGEMKI